MFPNIFNYWVFQYFDFKAYLVNIIPETRSVH